MGAWLGGHAHESVKTQVNEKIDEAKYVTLKPFNCSHVCMQGLAPVPSKVQSLYEPLILFQVEH